jgi:hypothetical protein
MHVIQVRHIFVLEQLGDFGIGPNRDRVPRRQLDGSLPHPPALRWSLVRQQSPQGFGNEISERGTAPHGRDLGALHEIIREIERGSHKCSYMPLCEQFSPC